MEWFRATIILRVKKNKIRVGITINFSIKFHANGLQQNIVFLKNLLDKLEDIDPFYIYEGAIITLKIER